MHCRRCAGSNSLSAESEKIEIMAVVIAIVGSGGKTTRIHQLAEEYRKNNKKVLVTTTTHMYVEADTELSGNALEICKKLEQNGYCMAGLLEEKDSRKIKGLPKNVYEEVCEYADIVLVEADGSKGMPVKFPAEHEPVIPSNVDEIQIVTGLCAVGRPLKEVCHRKELAKVCLGVSEDTVLTREHLEILLQKGYIEPLKNKYPKVILKLWLNDYKYNRRETNEKGCKVHKSLQL